MTQFTESFPQTSEHLILLDKDPTADIVYFDICKTSWGALTSTGDCEIRIVLLRSKFVCFDITSLNYDSGSLFSIVYMRLLFFSPSI